MRPLEIALLLVNVPLLAWWLSGRAISGCYRGLSAVPLLVLIVQLVNEGPRWHMAPGYLVTAWLFLTYCWQRVAQPRRWSALTALGLLLAAAGLGTVLPVFRLPNPTGSYAIGTVTWHLVDSAREETRSNRAGESRELMVQAWYPAEQDGPKQVYRSPAETEFKKAHLSLVRTHAATGVPVAKVLTRYPVVICTPSWTGRRNQNTVQAEELASHGFVIIGIDHPYGTDLTIFPDGRMVETALGKFMDPKTEESFETGFRTAETELQIRVADVRFVLDELERLSQSGPGGLLAGRVDTSHAGIFGHSFGGAVAAEVCRCDRRFKAGVDLDGFVFGESMKKGIGKPFLCFSCEGQLPSPAELETATGAARRDMTFLVQNVESIRRSLAEVKGYLLIVRGMSHMNFCDSPLYSPLKQLTKAGPIQPELSMEIVNAYLVSFFQNHLNGIDKGVETLSGCFPEVKIERPAKSGL